MTETVSQPEPVDAGHIASWIADLLKVAEPRVEVTTNRYRTNQAYERSGATLHLWVPNGRTFIVSISEPS